MTLRNSILAGLLVLAGQSLALAANYPPVPPPQQYYHPPPPPVYQPPPPPPPVYQPPPGYGAQFTQITPEGRQLVYRYVRNREPLFYDDL